MKKLYFDHNATSPVAPEVFQAISQYLTEDFGNPGSTHGYGLKAVMAVKDARARVAKLINCEPENIIFTSCATESNNMVVKSLISGAGDHLLTTKVEHPAILNTDKALQEKGSTATHLPVDSDGVAVVDDLDFFITDQTRLVSIMLANNETGAIQPVKKTVEQAKKRGIPVHTDASQAVGKTPVDVEELGVDYLTIAGHKMYAPKGIGALYAKNPETLVPMFHGGGQEHGLRSGTENVAYMAGLGVACEMLGEKMDTEQVRQEDLGRLLIEKLNGAGTDFMLLSENAPRLPQTMSIGFKNIPADRIMQELAVNDVAVSTGAACHTGEPRLSHVLEAMSVPLEYAMGVIRFSWGIATTTEDMEEMVARLLPVLGELRAQSKVN